LPFLGTNKWRKKENQGKYLKTELTFAFSATNEPN